MKVKYLKYIPLQEMIEAGLNPNEILFCSILMSFSKDNKELRVGRDNISEAMGVSPSTIKRMTPSLEKKGYIKTISGYKERNANTYHPTKKLKDLYGQNDPINRVKMTHHTPKGYVKGGDASPSLEGSTSPALDNLYPITTDFEI
jgi:DNA-binding MarR family transcriptional regulator